MRTLLRSKLMLPFLIISLLTVVLVHRSSWFRIPGLSSWAISGAFILKCAVGFVLLWLYGNVLDIERTDADVFRYFDDAVIMHSSASESLGIFWELFNGSSSEHLSVYFEGMHNWDSPRSLIHTNDNRTMIRLHSIILFFSNGDIRVHQVIFSFLSLLGLVALFKGLSHMSSLRPGSFWFICILPPSLLFWASGLLKETLVMLPLGLFVFGISKLGNSKKALYALVIGILGFLLVKPYVGLCLLPSLLFLFIDRNVRISSPWAAFCTVTICILLIYIGSFANGLDLIGLLAAEQAAFIDLARIESAGSFVEVDRFDDFKTFVAQAPSAISRCLFRPGIWEIRGALDALAAIENLLYILLFLAALVYRNMKADMRPVFFSLFFVLSMTLLIGSVTPVLGAVVRYKAPMLPFVIFLLAQLIDCAKIPLAPFRLER